MMSMMSGFPFTSIISFICSLFIISILDFLADLRNTSIFLTYVNLAVRVRVCVCVVKPHGVLKAESVLARSAVTRHGHSFEGVSLRLAKAAIDFMSGCLRSRSAILIPPVGFY
jgi:hypothetical protein